MHDVKRDSLFEETKGSKKKHVHKKSIHSHGHDHALDDSHDKNLASKYEGYEHRHVHEDHEEDEHHHNHEHEEEHHDDHEHGDEHDHEHDEGEPYHGHKHDHDEEEFHEHEEDEHHHEHPKERFIDRAFEHVHEHGHQFSHSHDHVHHKEEISIAHKWFKDPVRDWFALLVVGILIATNKLGLVKADLSKGFLVMAAVIGLYPLVKNSIIEGILEKRFTADLVVSLVLIIAMLYGQVFYVALAVFLILLGSFLRLDFSWKK